MTKAPAKKKKISADGIYDLTMEEYHSDCCAGPSISSSGLRTIWRECPLEYWSFSYLNKDAFPGPDTQTFSFGRAAHCLLLGDEDFKARYAVRPDEFDSWRTKAAKEWMAAQIADKRTVLIPDQLVHISYMARVLEKHPLVDTLLDGEIEKSLIWKDPETGIWLKSRPDIIPAFDGTLNDYKTTTSIIRPYELSRDIAKYGYFMQMALAEEGLVHLTDKKALNSVLTFQMSKAPYHVAPVELSAEYIALGHAYNRSSLRTLADCLDKGEWPGYSAGIAVLQPPDWMVADAERTTV